MESLDSGSWSLEATVFYFFWLVALCTQLALAPTLMLLRWKRSAWMPMWLMLLALVLGGWVLANLQIHLRQEYLGVLVRSMPDADIDDPIVSEWMADGAKLVFAAFCGWLYGPALWLLWSPVFALFWVGNRHSRGEQNETTVTETTDHHPMDIWGTSEYLSRR